MIDVTIINGLGQTVSYNLVIQKHLNASAYFQKFILESTNSLSSSFINCKM